MRKYKVFYINYEKNVVFTFSEKQYTRKLKKDNSGYYIVFKNTKLRIDSSELYF